MTLKQTYENLKKGCGNIYKHNEDGSTEGCLKDSLCYECKSAITQFQADISEQKIRLEYYRKLLNINDNEPYETITNDIIEINSILEDMKNE